MINVRSLSVKSLLWLLGFLALAPLAARAQTILPPVSSTAIEGSHVFCTGPCKLYSSSITTGASAGFLMIFDATSVPADGALTALTAPKYCWNFPANTGAGYTWPLGSGPSAAPSGSQFLKGLVVVFSTGANCLTKTLSATAFFTVQVQ